MGENYEEGISLESQKASRPRHSDLAIMYYNNKHSVVATMDIHVASIQMHLMCHSPSYWVTTVLQ
jgi:hypothetical protein